MATRLFSGGLSADPDWLSEFFVFEALERLAHGGGRRDRRGASPFLFRGGSVA